MQNSIVYMNSSLLRNVTRIQSISVSCSHSGISCGEALDDKQIKPDTCVFGINIKKTFKLENE